MALWKQERFILIEKERAHTVYLSTTIAENHIKMNTLKQKTSFLYQFSQKEKERTYIMLEQSCISNTAIFFAHAYFYDDSHPPWIYRAI